MVYPKVWYIIVILSFKTENRTNINIFNVNNVEVGCLAEGAPHSACQIILLVEISYSESGQLPKANELDFSLFLLCVMSCVLLTEKCSLHGKIYQ